MSDGDGDGGGGGGGGDDDGDGDGGDDDGVVCVTVHISIATVFQSCHGGDIMYAMRRGKLKPTLLNLPTQGIFNLPHHIDRA